MPGQSHDMTTAQACQHIIDSYLTRYQWQLLDREEFVRRVCNLCVADAAIDTHSAALQVYTATLYHACSGVEGQQRQERGYVELFHCLYQRARQCYPEVCADATQRAIETIHRTFHRCHRSETFLAFALQKLRDAGRAELRLMRSGDYSLDELSGEDEKTLGDHILVAQPPDPAEYALTCELRQRLAQCAQEFLWRNPRATQQLAALWMKYIDGFDDVTISRKLGKSVGCIYALRSRAAAKLRSDPSWQMLASELGLKVADSIAVAPAS